MKLFTPKHLCRAAIVAAMYCALTLATAPFAFGPLQLRPAEALTALPLLFFDAIPGLFIGCIIANLLSPFGILDVIFGSLTTLLAAILTRVCRKKPLLALAFPVVLNALILPIVWLFAGGESAFFINVFSIFITQTAFIYGLGYPLFRALKKSQNTMPFLQE